MYINEAQQTKGDIMKVLILLTYLVLSNIPNALASDFPVKGKDGSTYVEAVCWGAQGYTKYSPLMVRLENYSENLKSYRGSADLSEAVRINIGAADLIEGVFISVELLADEQQTVAATGLNQNVVTVNNGITEISCALSYKK